MVAILWAGVDIEGRIASKWKRLMIEWPIRHEKLCDSREFPGLDLEFDWADPFCDIDSLVHEAHVIL